MPERRATRSSTPRPRENKAFAEGYRKLYGKYPGAGSFQGYVTAHLIAQAYQKAGKYDKERFIDALEGLVIDSPIGKLEMRKCDHQLLLPTYFGYANKVPEYKDFFIGTDMVTIPAKDVVPTCEEVAAERAKAK